VSDGHVRNINGICYYCKLDMNNTAGKVLPRCPGDDPKPAASEAKLSPIMQARFGQAIIPSAITREAKPQEPSAWWGCVIYEGAHGLYLTKQEAEKDAFMGADGHIFQLIEKSTYDALTTDLRLSRDAYEMQRKVNERLERENCELKLKLSKWENVLRGLLNTCNEIIKERGE
jgi:hypothetical protein